MTKRFEFTVTGRGEFPYDMLRYDMCWPESEEESYKLSGDETGNRRDVRIRGTHTPTVGRWDSFNWAVSDVKEESY